jgi:DNA mismatch repair protein MutS
VANDLYLGKCSDKRSGLVVQENAANGILLYGTNAVGKTSLIRALGIAVIMAQAGLYVPCFAFTYRPYTAIFSRILGNDNLFKGLSTFAMEMSELRVILKMADQNSLVLGDELCSGTETESALSIFVAGLVKLHDIRASFIFATHCHEIVNYEEVRSLTNLALKHMAVHYDRELDALVYDRKVQDGPGNRMYGLEVCKSLHLDEEFLEQAYRIRTKYFPVVAGELVHTTSQYNTKKIRGLCEMCNVELGQEVHHLEPQCLANTDGMIAVPDHHGVFHKNHPANLLSVCEACHLAAHKKMEEGIKVSKKKTTKGYRMVSLG